MNTESYESHEPMTREPTASSVVTHEPIRRFNVPSVSWGAILAGLFVVLAIGWLMQMLGVALGVSIADASDSATLGGTLAPAVSIWILVSWLVSFFLGALVTAVLAGRIDETDGMLHGLTVWSVATVATVALGYYGLSAFVQTAQSAVSNVAQGAGVALSATASGAQSAASGMAQFTNVITERYGEEIQNQLYESASRIAAEQGEQVTEEDIRTAVEALDQRTLRRIVLDLTNDDSEGAAELLAENTQLPQEEAQALMDATYKALEERFGNPDNQQSLAADLKTSLVENVDSYLAQLDSTGGPQVSEQDIQTALDQLDAEAAQEIGSRLIRGDMEGAKRSLVRHTDLTRAQVQELVDGATEQVNQQIAVYEEEIDETVEAVSTYTSEVLWVIFASSAAALAAALGGGYLGADSSRRIYRSDNRDNRGTTKHVKHVSV